MADTQSQRQDTGGGIPGLCTAIIAQAIIDYQELCDKDVDYIKAGKDNWFSKEEINEFIKSDWCKSLLQMIGDHINIDDLIFELRRQTKTSDAKIKKKLVAYTKDGDFVESFDTLADGAVFAHLKSSVSICQCCKGTRKTAGGFVWRYV